MKKNLSLSFVIILSILFFSSCKKDYTCACTYSYTGSSFLNDTSYSFNTIIKDSKKNAEASCANASSSITDFSGGTQSTTCAIK